VAELLAPAVASATAAWTAVGPGAGSVPTPLPQGTLPAALAPGLAADLLPAARAVAEPLRQFGVYAPALAPQASDDILAELLRYLGRDPKWSP
jgi:hypothetical protein